MSFIGKNIKKIRAVKKMSQTDFANIFDMSRTAIGAYEDGRAEPKIETIIQIAQYFQLSIDTLLTKELTVNELFKFNLITEELAEEANKANENRDELSYQTPFVGLNSSLDYVVNYHNQDFINQLPVISFPFISHKKSRAFQLEGSEMEYENTGLHHKDILLCIPVKEMKDLVNDQLYVVVHEKGLIIRRYVGRQKSYLHLKADNPSYDVLLIKEKQVLEIWEATAVFSDQLKVPSRLEQRVAELEEALVRIQGQLNGN